jgi:diguanylate cyclase (GGDEF)-like protein
MALRGNAAALGIVIIAIFSIEFVSVRRRDLAAIYLLAALIFFAGGALQGALVPSSAWIATVVVAALVISCLTGSVEIATKNRLVDETHRAEETAHLDPLTGLQNRTVLFERLDGALASARRRRHDVALLYIDLNNFKHVNDRFGHRAGDEVLVQVGYRLKRAVRTDEVAARVGGDEFVVLLPHVERFSEHEEAATRFARILSEPFMYQGNDLEIGASVGVARSPYDGFDRERLLAAADAAMYARKQGALREA